LAITLAASSLSAVLLIWGAAIWESKSLPIATAEQVLTAAGFGLDEVDVSGHRFTPDSDVFDSLDLANVKTMIALDTARVQARLERLPWVSTATLTRNFPGRISVTLTERAAYAVWINGSGAVLVDKTGRELSAIRPADMPHLPRISGIGAPQAAGSLYQMLANYPTVAGRLQLATRLDGRRWSLTLANGVQVELPSEGEATALAGALQDAPEVLDAPRTIVDLRSSTRIAVSPAGLPAGAP
jgi:cell division protein FtsQ